MSARLQFVNMCVLIRLCGMVSLLFVNIFLNGYCFGHSILRKGARPSGSVVSAGVASSTALARGGNMQKCFARSLVCVVALAYATASHAADVSVSIGLDSDFVEFIRAQRRAKGLDPPDHEADRRFLAFLKRVEQQRAKATPNASRFKSGHGSAAVASDDFVALAGTQDKEVGSDRGNSR